MIPSEQSIIGSSISPVTHNEPALSGNTSENKELVEPDGVQREEVTPAPKDHEEIRQPRIGRRPMAPTKAEVEEHYRCT